MIETFGSDQILFLLIVMAITATAAGFFAGFFGIGGGIITVPCLFYIFSSIGIDKSLIMHLSVGTSFAIIVPTAMMSVYTHYKHKAVDLNILKTYGIFVVIGVIIGAFSAAQMETKSLVLFFSLIIYLLALNLIFLKDKTKIKIKFNLFQRTIFGFVVGFISSLMGIGGAIMNVPILKFVGYNINKAIGTAASIGFLISIFGTIGFLTTGIIMHKNIPLSSGFINIPAFLIFIPITIIMAKIGATTVHKMRREIIAKLFGLFLIIIASRFLYEYFNF
ncbi:sulfite exporter TauE/SafE family protein [Pelagibacteraceae bacterium]|nr:sulfite exporter TauE/SafE family protein [Pelagibacteraceae bacterium]